MVLALLAAATLALADAGTTTDGGEREVETAHVRTEPHRSRHSNATTHGNAVPSSSGGPPCCCSDPRPPKKEIRTQVDDFEYEPPGITKYVGAEKMTAG